MANRKKKVMAAAVLNTTELLDQFSIQDKYQELNWTGTFQEYLNALRADPRPLRNAYQRLYDVVARYGYEEYEKFRDKQTRWKFFDDPDNDGRNAVFGIDEELNALVELIKGGARGFGVDKRVLLMHGPVGSAKSTIARLFKQGLERYSRLPEGAIYTFLIRDIESGEDVWVESPMHEEPLKLVPEEVREPFVNALLQGVDLPFHPLTAYKGSLDPASRKYFQTLMKHCHGNWQTVVNEHVKVCRFIISERDRRGIGTYQPKDEKSQDATELTGDINYRNIAKYGSDSDPRAFNFDGEFNVANRGLIEFCEVLKLDVAFLYDLLFATQEKSIKPRKFAQTDIDEVIIGHTNNPEYKKLQSNEFMEALKDRTIKVDIGYNLELSQETRIYERDFSDPPKHIAPHTFLIGAMFACLTRIKDPRDSQITPLQKLKLYDGKTLPGYTIDNVQELRKEGKEDGEGMDGISPRFIQDKISNALASNKYSHVNPFILLLELKKGLKSHALINDETKRGHYEAMAAVVEEEYTDIVKNEVQRAICADEDAIARLCANYVDNVKAFCQKERIKNKYTGQDEEPDEQLMRSIEEKIDIPNSRKEDFRREVMNFIGALAVEGKKFEFHTNERLQKALELKLFEDSRNTINLSTMHTDVIDADTQAQIDIVKQRLIKNYGYNDESASDVLDYVASIFTRGDMTDQG